MKVSTGLLEKHRANQRKGKIFDGIRLKASVLIFGFLPDDVGRNSVVETIEQNHPIYVNSSNSPFSRVLVLPDLRRTDYNRKKNLLHARRKEMFW